MKILWVKAGKLLPVDTGGRIRSFNILRNLQEKHHVVLLSYYGGPQDTAYERDLVQQLPGTLFQWTQELDRTGLARTLDYVRKLPCRSPFAVTKFLAPQVRRTVSEWMSQQIVDVAVCDFLSASLNFPQRLSVPTVLFQHNVESVLWRRMAENETGWLKKLVYAIEARKMKRYEPIAIRKFHHVIAVSEEDKRLMAESLPRERISRIPTGVDLRQYYPVAGTQSGDPLVVFTGSMDFEPNIDGIGFFCRDIWPRIKQAVPAARLRIVGRNPHREIRRLSSAAVEVTGRVPSIVEHLRQAKVVIVPLRMGGGTRLKIYEAMAVGRAVVSTSIGAEGLEVRHGHDIHIANQPEEFARALILLLTNEPLRREYEANASQTAAQFDWSAVATQFAQILEQVIRGKAQPAPQTLAAPTVGR